MIVPKFLILFLVNKKSEISNLINEQFDSNECDLITDGPICLFNGDKIILPYSRPENLIGYWNFDEIRPLDYSGLRNHALNIVKSGPSFGGIGNSAFFSNGDHLEVINTKAFESENYSITFWIFIIQDFFTETKGIRYCPLIQKGKDYLFSKKYSRNPSIYYDRKNKNLKVFVKTENTKQNLFNEGEFLVSNSKILQQKWMHISLIKNDKNLKLYINGILDSSLELKEKIEKNSDNLFIGGAPWVKDNCDYPFLMDDLRYYNSDLKESFIHAEAASSLGGIEPSLIQFGCIDCSLKKASESCNDGYRLGTTIELHTSGYQVARSLGWMSWNTHIWTYSALKTPKKFDKLKGLGVCFKDNK